MNGKDIFKLLGDLDDGLVEDAWAEHDEEVIIIEQKSPMRFVKAAAAIAAGLALLAGGVYGFSRLRNSVGYSPGASVISDEDDTDTSTVDDGNEEGCSGVESVPVDEPTIFMGFGNDPIMSSDVTSVSVDKKPSEIMPEDYGVSVYCEGFCYFKEPLGIAYDSYHNPEMFAFTGDPDKTDGMSFQGETPRNTNPWKRLNVGEEMCGLKLKSAATQFRINEPGDGAKIEILGDDDKFVEFEGTIEIEGILCVSAPSFNSDGGLYCFYPTEDKLPILGCSLKTVNDYRAAYAHETCAVHIYNEYPYIQINEAFANYDEIDGIDKGDAVLARLTLSSVTYGSGDFVFANMDDVEILSEPIAHVDEWMQK